MSCFINFYRQGLSVTYAAHFIVNKKIFPDMLIKALKTLNILYIVMFQELH